MTEKPALSPTTKAEEKKEAEKHGKVSAADYCITTKHQEVGDSSCGGVTCWEEALGNRMEYTYFIQCLNGFS